MAREQFLSLVAKDLTKRYENRISDLTLVFPSHRPGLFFQNHLSSLISRPIWSPRITTISDLMKDLSGFQLEEQFRLVARLHSLYCSITGHNESFDNFYFWGEVLLTDFDQIDKYLVDAKQLFRNIKDIKEIDEKFGELSPEQSKALEDYLGVMTGNNISALRDKYLSVWEYLFEIYSQFRDSLSNENLAYEGMIYRKAAELVSNPNTTTTSPTPIAFIGFNALNESEKTVLKKFKSSGEAFFYWDYDPVFVEDPDHEAGAFIRENLTLFPNALPKEFFISEDSRKKTIKLVSAPSTVAQSKLIPRMLAEFGDDNSEIGINTAIVLPRENLLIPTLQGLPNNLDLLNITLGYPLKETPAYSLVEHLVKLQMNIQHDAKGEVKFYHRNVFGLLNHPYIKLCNPEDSSKLSADIRRTNRIFPHQSELEKSTLLKKIFRYIPEGNEIVSYLLSVCEHISQEIASRIEQEGTDVQRIDLEFLYSLHKCLTRLKDTLSILEKNISHKLFLQLIRKAFIQERVSFSGEPLAGIQVIGLLETRCLDFDNLIILSFNEDIIPGKNQTTSFITPSLRIGFNLPTYKHQDSVYAYYFYRLLNRAKKVFLVYSNRTEGLSSGERSRFALQLQLEEIYGEIETIPVGFHLSISPTPPITITKSNEVIESLMKNLNKRGNGITLSPSGLTTYLNCPLQFYFRYGAKISEADEVLEEAGALEFGKVIHQTMEMLYEQHTNTVITSSTIDSILKNEEIIQKALNLAFNEVFFSSFNSDEKHELTGRNILAKKAMHYTLKKMLRCEKERAPFRFIGHENEVYHSFKIDIQGVEHTIHLGGYIDRLEEKNNKIHVIDYKTGKYSSTKGVISSIDEIFDSGNINEMKEVLQIFCYCLAITNLYKGMPIKPFIWFVRKMQTEEEFSVKIKTKPRINEPIEDFYPYLSDFEQGVEKLLTEIFNPTIDFTQTSDNDKCKVCQYASICGKD